MGIAIITGSAGVVGSSAARLFSDHFDEVIGIDNDQRKQFFGPDGSTALVQKQLHKELSNFQPLSADVRDFDALEAVFKSKADQIEVIVHAAAQPSHDWAAKDPRVDFSVNATGTLNMLECLRLYSPKASFIFLSTNKVYGDVPNSLPFVRFGDRLDLPVGHELYNGVNESMRISPALHSVFGASKVAADVMTQEYGRYFGLNTVAFRGGCLTGPLHSGVPLHGFLSYLTRCAVRGDSYTIIGHDGLQVRDNLHCGDLAKMFLEYHSNPRPGEIYNVGGGRELSCSILEAIQHLEARLGKRVRTTYLDAPRIGDHKWYVTDLQKFKCHYPGWSMEYSLDRLFDEMADSLG